MYVLNIFLTPAYQGARGSLHRIKSEKFWLFTVGFVRGGGGESFKNVFFFLIDVFIFIFWLWWVFVAMHGCSPVAVSGGYSPLQPTGFSLRWLVLLLSTDSRHRGFSRLQ